MEEIKEMTKQEIQQFVTGWITPAIEEIEMYEDKLLEYPHEYKDVEIKLERVKSIISILKKAKTDIRSL